MSKIDLDEILELEGNATPAGWPVKVKNAYSSGVTYSMGAGPEYLSGIAGDKLDSIELERLKFATHDAELIAVARNNIKALCLELKAARECVEYLKKLAGLSKGSYALDGIPYRELDCLVNYDEATK